MVVLLLFVIFAGVVCNKFMGPTVSEAGDRNENINHKETEQQETVSNPVFADIDNLSEDCSKILSKGTRAFFAGHAVDENFLNWVGSHYGTDAVRTAADNMSENSAEAWYDATGRSMQVLWAEYCREYNYETYLWENTTWLECASEDLVTLDFIGDINLDSEWCTMETLKDQENGLEDCFSADLFEELRSSDLTIANNEFTFSERGKPIEGKEYTFRADPESVNILDKLGIDMVSLGNNHVYDYGEYALLDTISTLDGEGILTMGAGADLDEADDVQYVIANGRRIALVAATEVERYSSYTQEAAEDVAGVLKMTNPEYFLTKIREAKENSDYVIAFVHWGEEGNSMFSSSQHGLAEQIVEAGADVIIGSHPHRLQGVEYIDGVPVVYSLGNFWFSDATLFTAVAQVRIDAEGKISLSMLPCVQEQVKTVMITNEEMLTRYLKYVADMSVDVAVDETGRVYSLGTDSGTKDSVLERLREADVEWYMSGQAYSRHSSGYDLDGSRIDVVGNLQ